MNDLVRIEKPAQLAVSIVERDDLVADFLSTLGEKTRLAYLGDLKDFARSIASSGTNAAVAELVDHGIGAANLLALRYKAELTERKLAPATIARRLSALRSVCELAARIGRIDWVLRISSPKVEAYRDVEGPGREGWKRMVKHLALLTHARGRRGIKATRDLAICRLSHDLMLRRAEVIGLDLEHIDRAMESNLPEAVHILGKGRTGREKMELPPVTAEALAAWLILRGDEPGPVFCPLDHAISSAKLPRMDGRSIARLVSKAGHGAGLAKHQKPHGLRHEAITHAAELGEGLLDIQIVARHKDPRTTQRYIDRVANPQPRISRRISEE